MSSVGDRCAERWSLTTCREVSRLVLIQRSGECQGLRNFEVAPESPRIDFETFHLHYHV